MNQIFISMNPSIIIEAALVRVSAPTYAAEDDVVAWGYYWPSVFVSVVKLILRCSLRKNVTLISRHENILIKSPMLTSLEELPGWSKGSSIYDAQVQSQNQ